MEGSLVGLAGVTWCAMATARCRAGQSGARFFSCSCSFRDEPARVAYSSVSMIPRAAKSVAHLEAWNGNGHMWTTSLEDYSFVLVACEDCCGGMVVDADRLPSDMAVILLLQGKKGVWLKLPLDRSDYIPLAVKEGFRYHHAEESYVMLTYWIPDEPCLLPANASHRQMRAHNVVLQMSHLFFIFMLRPVSNEIKGPFGRASLLDSPDSLLILLVK